MDSLHSALPDLRILAVNSFYSPGIASMGGTRPAIFTGPLSTTELYDHGGKAAVLDQLTERLVYGNYPRVYLADAGMETILARLCGESLITDITFSHDIRLPSLLKRTLEILARGLGKQVTYAGIAARTGKDTKTAEKYLELLERAYLVYRIWSYCKNVSNELRHSFKVGFWDNGIRNSCLDDFRPVDKRQDADALWENYFITERRKALLYTGRGFRQHFWRSTQNQEISLIELSGHRISAYGLKWGPGKPLRLPLTFRNSYPNVRMETANRFNYLNHTLEQQLRLVL
jgi:predicted AAA+ superfamily ATPase